MGPGLFSILSLAVKFAASFLMLAIYAKSLSHEYFIGLASGLLIAQVTCIFADGGITTVILKSSRTEGVVFNTKKIVKSSLARLATYFCMGLLVFIYFVWFYQDRYLACVVCASYVYGVLTSLNETYLLNIRVRGNFRGEFFSAFLQSLLTLGLASITLVLPEVLLLSLIIPKLWGPVKLVWQNLADRNLLKIWMQYYGRLKSYSLDAVFSNLSLSLDALLISLMLGAGAYAKYQPTSRFSTASLAFGGVIASLAVTGEKKEFSKEDSLKHFALWFLSSGLLFAVCFFVFCPLLVSLFFSTNYQIGSSAIFLMACVLLFRFAAAGFGLFLTTVNKQNFRMRANLCTTLGALFFVPLVVGSIESVIALILLSQIFLFVIYAIASIKYVKKNSVSDA